MGSTYYKRFRMEVDLRRDPVASHPATLPPGYRFVAWNDSLLDEHARTKYRCFRDEIDAIVFPCLGNLDGCRRLMREIRNKTGFLPSATWLIAWDQSPQGLIWCGTIQTIRSSEDVGTIQNIGVLPSHRGIGLGTSLIQQAMAGLAQHSITRGSLEVTSDNSRAVQLYKRLGFHRYKTVYKTIKHSQSQKIKNASGELAGMAEPAIF